MDGSIKRRLVRIVVLLWLGWYVWGPVDPVVDFWDTPREQMRDMVRAAGGIVVLVGAGFAIAQFQSRNLRDGLRASSHTALGLIACLVPVSAVSCFSVPSQVNHGPPVPLRI